MSDISESNDEKTPPHFTLQVDDIVVQPKQAISVPLTPSEE